MAKTIAEMRGAIEDAIVKCAAAEAYTDRQQEVKRARMKDLVEAWERLSAAEEADQAGSMSSIGVILPPV